MTKTALIYLAGIVTGGVILLGGYHLYNDHKFLHWLAVTIEQQQKANAAAAGS